MSRPKVSVSLITYNHEKYIAACLDSIVKQVVDFDWEIIVGDDCSKDSTPEIVAAYAQKYPNLIKPIFRKTNLGLVRNAISTIEACNGQYIALMEGDDFWVDEHKLKIQADYLDKNTDCAFCFTNQYTFYEEVPDVKSVFFTGVNKPREKFELEFFIENNVTIPNNTKMFRRQVQPTNLPDWFYYSFNWDWMLHILQAINSKMGYIDRVTLAYRRHNEAVFILKDQIDVVQNGINSVKALNKFLNYKYDYRFKNLWWEYRELALVHLSKRNIIKFLFYYLRYVFSYKSDPVKIKDELGLLKMALQNNKVKG